MGCTVHGILQARILEWLAFPFSRGSSQPRSPSLQADSVSAEPRGKPKNTGVGSLSLLQQIIPNPGIELGSPALQADSLPSEPPSSFKCTPTWLFFTFKCTPVNTGFGRSPGEGKGYPPQYSGLKNSMESKVHEVSKSWTRLSNFDSHIVIQP